MLAFDMRLLGESDGRELAFGFDFATEYRLQNDFSDLASLGSSFN